MGDERNQFALVSVPDDLADDARLARAAAAVAELPGVIRSAGFVRETPSGLPFAAALGGSGLVVAELTGDSAELTGDKAVNVGTAAGGAARGTFTLLTTFSRQAGRAPDFAAAAGILLVLLNNADPAHDDDFNRWYNDVHLADVTAAGGFWGAIRARNAAAEPGPASARYLALYCTDGSDVLAQQMKVRAATATMVLWPATDQVHSAAYRLAR